MNDLLQDKHEISNNNAICPSSNNTLEDDIEAGIVAGAVYTPDATFADFFPKVHEIKEHMVTACILLRQLQEDNEVSKTLTKPTAIKETKEKMELCTSEVIRITKIIKRKVEELDKENLVNRRMPGCEEGTSVDRSRMAITAALKKKLESLVAKFLGKKNLRQKLREEYRIVVERRIFTVTGQEPDSELVERLIGTGESERIFEKAIQDQGKGHILSTLLEIQEQHETVKDLEQKLRELHQIFLDMAVLVEAQGESLDNIEAQVAKAADYTETGTTALEKEKQLQKNKRKWMMIAIILLLVVIVIIIVPVLEPWKNKQA